MDQDEVMDEDLANLDRDALIAEVKRLRTGSGSTGTVQVMNSAGIIRSCGDFSLKRPIPFPEFLTGRSFSADASDIGSRSIDSCRTHHERKMISRTGDESRFR
jgi:hypothetical protein